MTEIAKSTGTKGMAGLALPFYETALELTAGMACGRLDQLVKYPSAVVVLVSTSLDAYINETLAYLHFLELEPTKKRQIAELQKNKELREKWVDAPEVLAGTALDKQAEPYLSFDLRLRNKLVHYSPAFRTPSEYPLAAIDEYKQRFPFTYEGKC